MKTILKSCVRRQGPTSIGGLVLRGNHWCLPIFASAAVILQSQTASAAVVYSGILNHQVPVTAQGTVINFVTGTILNGTVSGVPGWDVNPYGTSATNVGLLAAQGTGIMRNPAAGTNTFRTNLALWTVVGASAFYYGNSAAAIGTSVGQWTTNSTGYFGLKFIVEATSTTHYGFVAMRIGANATDRTIIGFGYETTANTAITVTPIPVPAPAAGLIALAAGLRGRRRR
ncbi:MAG: hypothetical protein ACKO4V_06785 [Planctomycetota bacterium]